MPVRPFAVLFPTPLHWFHWSNDNLYCKFIAQFWCFCKALKICLCETNSYNIHTSSKWFIKLLPNFKFFLPIKVNKMCYCWSFLPTSLFVVLYRNCNQLIKNFIPLTLLPCMFRISFLLHLMLVFLLSSSPCSVGCFWYYWSQCLNSAHTTPVGYFIYSS